MLVSRFISPVQRGGRALSRPICPEEIRTNWFAFGLCLFFSEQSLSSVVVLDYKRRVTPRYRWCRPGIDACFGKAGLVAFPVRPEKEGGRVPCTRSYEAAKVKYSISRTMGLPKTNLDTQPRISNFSVFECGGVGIYYGPYTLFGGPAYLVRGGDIIPQTDPPTPIPG